LLRLKRRTALVAAASLFAALYAALGTIPISKLILGSGNFLTASNFITPMAGMIFGPFVGGFATMVGDLLGVYAGYISFGSTGLSVMAADLATVVTAGLAFTGKRKTALALPIAILVLYWADPISVLFVGPIPFTWLHMLSLIPLAFALFLEAGGKITKLNPFFVVSVTFAALLCGQLTGTLVGQELSVRVYQTLTLQAWRGIVPLFFPLYPVERVLFTIVGSLVSLPVLRALWRREHPHAPS
jgi:hypothetical protein